MNRAALESLTDQPGGGGAAGSAPALASVTVTNTSPTNTQTYALTYGAVTGTYDDYCILENSTAVAGCTWTLGTLPASFNVSATQNAKVLSVWIRNADGISSRVDSNSVTLDTSAPSLASATVTNSSPTANRTYGLTYGSVTGTYSQYCILENSTTVASCSWTAGTLPASYDVTTANGAKVLSIWLRDTALNVSTRVDTASVTYNGTVSISPVTTTATNTSGSHLVESARYSSTVLPLANGDFMMIGGAWGTGGGTTLVKGAVTFHNVSHKWTGSAPMWTGRMLPMAVELSNGNVLAFGGCMDTSDTGTATVEVYVPADEKWSQRASMSTARCFATATLLDDGRVLVVGGRNAGTYHSTTEIYDPTTNLWTTGPALGGARFGHSAIKLSDGRVVILGGHNGAATLTSVLIYDPSTNAFTAGNPMSTARRDFGAIVMSSAETGFSGQGILVLGGFDSPNYLTSVEIYDVAGNTWTGKSAMGDGRRYNVYAKTSAGVIHAFGGQTTGGNSTANVQRYTLATDTWDARAGIVTGSLTVSTPLGRQAVGLLGDGTVIVAAGTVSNADVGRPYVAEYTPATNTWVAEGYDFPRNMQNPTVAALDDGRVLSCGGNDRFGSYASPSRTCYVYDPAKNAYKAVGRMQIAVGGAQIQVLTNGIAAVFGGTHSGESTATRQFHLFDPSTDTLTNGPNMPYYGFHFSHFALSGNRLLLAGGMAGTLSNNFGFGTEKCHIYDYGTNSWTATGDLPGPRGRAAFAKTPSGRIFVFGGYSFDGSAHVYNDLYEFNVGAGTWSTKSNVMGAGNPTPREYPTMAVYVNGANEYLYLIGGDQDIFGTVYAANERYDVTNDTWTAMTNVPVAMTLHASHVNSATGKLWTFGGVWSSSNGVYEYDIAGDSWTAKTNMQQEHYNLFRSTAVLQDGRIFIQHGYNDDATKVAEVYHFVSPVNYTATGGDGLYTFTKVSGLGTLYEKIRRYIPPYPLPGVGSATIEVEDGVGASVPNSTVNY